VAAATPEIALVSLRAANRPRQVAVSPDEEGPDERFSGEGDPASWVVEWRKKRWQLVEMYVYRQDEDAYDRDLRKSPRDRSQPERDLRIPPRHGGGHVRPPPPRPRKKSKKNPY